MMDEDYKYQANLSEVSPILLDDTYKQAKVNKMIAVLEDVGALSDRCGLAADIGCSAGFFTRALAPYFSSVVGMDIDEGALSIARDDSSADNVIYISGDSMRMPFPDGSVDLIICNHVYEHVPDAEKLFSEIERVLSSSGACYLGAASRLTVIEPHYKLPFLSWLPKILANPYMKLANKGDEYYENLRTYWGIQQLISPFFVKDYTLSIIYEPDKYCARDMIQTGGWIEKTPKIILRIFYCFLPSYILILRKSGRVNEN